LFPWTGVAHIPQQLCRGEALIPSRHGVSCFLLKTLGDAEGQPAEVHQTQGVWSDSEPFTATDAG